MSSLVAKVAIGQHSHTIAMHEKFIMSSVSDKDGYSSCHLEEAVANELQAFVIVTHTSLQIDLLRLLIVAVVGIFRKCFKR